MFELFFAFLRYFFALAFGTFLAARFVGVKYTKKNISAIALFIVLTFVIQLCCLMLFDMERTVKLYPLIAHIPTLLFLVLYFKKTWLISLTTTAIVFLCCQPLRWGGTLFGELFHHVTLNHIGYILTGIVLYFLIEKYAQSPIYHMMHRSVKSCLLLAAMPVFYYLFEYVTIVYTNFLYSGEQIAVQFMPFIIAAFYLLFVLLSYEEMTKQLAAQQHVQMLETQFKQAQKEFAALEQMQLQAATHRHDMRHQLSLLQSMAQNGQLHDIERYLQLAQADLDAITPIRYCEHETVNLILSSFATKAQAKEITLTLDIRLPETLPLSDTELCSLLSNALENALHACSAMPKTSARSIQLRLFSKNNKLCIDLQNSCTQAPSFEHGLPISTDEAHGFGTKSIVHIIEKHGGIYHFAAHEQHFIFQATI